MQGVVFFSTKGLELRYVFSRIYNLNGTQQLNKPALACDVLPRMLTKKIKNIFCSEIQKAEGFQEAFQENQFKF